MYRRTKVCVVIITASCIQCLLDRLPWPAGCNQLVVLDNHTSDIYWTSGVTLSIYIFVYPILLVNSEQ